MDRGDVGWVDLDPPAGRRPVLIVTRSSAVTGRDQATVALIPEQQGTSPVRFR